jgi:hypothetical protein
MEHRRFRNSFRNCTFLMSGTPRRRRATDNGYGESQKGHGHSIRSGMPTPTPKTINSMFSWQAVRVIY